MLQYIKKQYLVGAGGVLSLNSLNLQLTPHLHPLSHIEMCTQSGTRRKALKCKTRFYYFRWNYRCYMHNWPGIGCAWQRLHVCVCVHLHPCPMNAQGVMQLGDTDI